MYLEARIVDHGGQVRRNQPQMNDDDWSAVEDMVRDELLFWGGTGLNPVFSLTDKGWSTTAALRRWRGEGKRVADFDGAWLGHALNRGAL